MTTSAGRLMVAPLEARLRAGGGAGPGWRGLLLLSPFVLLAGLAVSSGGPWALAALGIGGGLAVISVLPGFLSGRRSRVGVLAVEAPILLLLLSTLVFRIRSTEDITDNPFDPAGLFRLACLMLALLLGMMAFATPRASLKSGAATWAERIPSRGFRLYSLYTIWVFVGALASTVPLLTVFHGVELVTALVVFRGAVRAVGPGAVGRIEKVLYGFLVALMASIWLSVVLAPGIAVRPVDSPLPWQIEGAFPYVAANGVGTLGAIVALWSLARFMSPQIERVARPRVSLGIALVGFATLLGAQYRTGYLAFLVGLVVLLALRGRGMLALVLVGAATVGVVWGPRFVREAGPLLLRGESAQTASELSSRVYWWQSALPVWREAPITGKGLLTATRYEVLAPIGRTETSTIHSTWIEALVGTGVVGTALLASAFLVVVRRAIGEALRGGRAVPLMVLTVIGIRSVTGTTFEASGRSLLLFLLVALALGDHRFRPRALAVPPHGGADGTPERRTISAQETP